MNTNRYIILFTIIVLAITAVSIVIYIWIRVCRHARLLRMLDAIEIIENKPLPPQSAFRTIKRRILRTVITSSQGIATSKNPDEDPRKLNQEKTCCICLEEYVDEKGNIRQPDIERDIDIQAAGDTSPSLPTDSVHRDRTEATEQQDMLHPRTINDSTIHNKADKAGYRSCGTLQTPSLEDDLILGLLKCGHAYHFECIWKWMQSRTKCPICRNYTNMSASEIKAVTYHALFTSDAKGNCLELKDSFQDLPHVHNFEAHSRKAAIFTVEGTMNRLDCSPSQSRTNMQQYSEQNDHKPVGYIGRHQKQRPNRGSLLTNESVSPAGHLPRTQWCLY